MNIEQLHRLTQQEEIDYHWLLFRLKNYARPRDKISDWLKHGDLIRVKKGLYIFGKHNPPYSIFYAIQSKKQFKKSLTFIRTYVTAAVPAEKRLNYSLRVNLNGKSRSI